MVRHLYCEKCGEELIEKEKIGLGFYVSGRKKERVMLQCPNGRWWNFHTRIYFVTNPRDFARPDEWFRPDWILASKW